MPRTSRLLSDSKTYHVIVRGNEKKPIFLEQYDYEMFLGILEKVREKGRRYSLFAYCLMNNHVHLVIRDNEEPLSKIMQRICVRYALYFNKKYERVGHLFQDRFRSEVIDNDAYLLSAVRYIHKNPVKAGLVSLVEEYQWSSYSQYAHNSFTRAHPVVDTSLVLSIFSSDKDKAVEIFLDFSKQEDANIFYEHDKSESLADEEIMAKRMIVLFLTEHGVSIDALALQENRELKRQLLIQLKNKTNLSIRQLSELTGINRNVVQRIN